MGTSTIHFYVTVKVCDKTGFINATKMLFAATNECTIFIISTIYDETKVSHQSGCLIYARAKYVVILANCLHEKGTAARRIRKNR